MTLSLIVAIADNGVIGRQNQLPWHIPADLKKFKQLTINHPIIMGRKTFESIGRPLPGRTNIVISRNPDIRLPENVRTAKCLEDAISIAKASTGCEEIFVIGGAEIYRLALPLAERCYITRVHIQAEGDAQLLNFPGAEFELIESTPLPPSGPEEIPANFEVFRRR